MTKLKHNSVQPMISFNVMFSLDCLPKNAHYWPTKSKKTLESANEAPPPQAEETSIKLHVFLRHVIIGDNNCSGRMKKFREELAALFVYLRQLNHCHDELTLV